MVSGKLLSYLKKTKQRKIAEMVTRCYSLSFVVTRCHSLSLVVTRFHSLYHSLSFVFICCHSLYHSLSAVVALVVIRCHSLSFVVTRSTTCLSFYKRSNSYILTGRLNKVRTKLKGTWLIIFPDYTMLLSLLRRHWIQNIEQNKKLKAKDIETWKTQT